MKKRAVKKRAVKKRDGTALLALLGFAIASAGCAGGLRLAELPVESIAVRYLDPEQARRATEDLGELELASRSRRARQPGRSKLGVASATDIDQFLSSSFKVRGGLPETRNRQEADEHSPRLALLDPRSRELTVLPQARAGSVPVDWSLDRRSLLFTQIRRGYAQLFEYDRESGEVRPMTREPGAHPWGCYGPDGRIVAERVDYSSEPPRSNLVISHPGGGRFRDLTPGPSDQRPACSPDGTAIAYISGGRGVEGNVIVRMLGEAEGSAPSDRELRAEAPIGLPHEIGPGIDPSFSPDGKTIVYSAATRVRADFGVEDRWRLRRARVSGLGRGSFEMGPVDQFEPTISPDGRIIAYIGIDPAFNQVLYVRRVDGSGERILFNDGAALGPVW